MNPPRKPSYSTSLESSNAILTGDRFNALLIWSFPAHESIILVVIGTRKCCYRLHIMELVNFVLVTLNTPPTLFCSGALRYACCDFSSYIRHLQCTGQWSDFSCEAIHDSKWVWIESIDAWSNCAGSAIMTRQCSSQAPRYKVDSARPSLSSCAEQYWEKNWFFTPELIKLMMRENRAYNWGLQVVR